MKSKVLALLIPALLAAGAAHAAEVYNKDGNKLDLYGKVDGLHYFSDNSAKDGCRGSFPDGNTFTALLCLSGFSVFRRITGNG